MGRCGGNTLTHYNEPNLDGKASGGQGSYFSGWLLSFALIAIVFSVIVPPAKAQITSSTVGIALTATLGESLTLTATPTSVSFTLVKGGSAAGSSSVAMTTTWVLLPTRANLYLDGYFASATAALTDGASTPDLIPTSAVYGLVSTGSPTTATAFTQSAALGPAGAGLLLFTVPLTSSNREGTRTDSLVLSINLASLPQLPAGTYTGTLTLQAQAL